MKKYLITVLFLCGILLIPTNTYATSYSSRHACNNFELAKTNSNGSISTISCHSSYQEAKTSMNKKSDDNLIIIDERSTPKIVDAKYALVDLTVNGLTYFYESPSLATRQYTGINTDSSYGGVDAAFIEVDSANYAAKVKIANFTGWISKDAYEIVPLSWVKSSSSYTVTSNEIKHNYISNVNKTTSIGSRTLGPKPDMLNTGTYYSYDGHYFYKNLKTMLTDYKNKNHNNAVNKNNPYYNYYMYLSNHTKTTYSSLNIDEYTKALGYTMDTYSDTAKDSTSSLYGKGIYFYNSQQIFGINAILSYSLSRNETGNGRSNLSINKHNGFGLNAVDSNPYNGANYYATFASSIYGYASKWNSYGYSYATDWRYFGPAFGDKYNGMNVKYATDAYWSEKMASNYYYFDRYFGLNDYNYYQLGVVTKPTNAYFYANTSKKIYEYPEEEDQVVIVGESGSYYKVMSDMNIDSNGNLVGSKYDYNKPYNWNSYVYVNKNDIRLINKGKNGYITPNSVTSYQDANYTYDLYVENTILKPKVAKLKNNTSYYNDSTLTQKTGKTVLKDKLVMVYSAAYNSSKQIVAYLITSDYFYDQKAWVPATSLSFINSDYGLQTVNIKGAYEWVCSSAIENINYKISGQYTNSYFPITGEVYSDGKYWYKIPVSLTSNTNSYGYILKSEADAYVTKYSYKAASNTAPVINAKDISIREKQTINLLSGVTAIDTEDGNLTSKIKVTGTVNNNTPGTYKVTYTVTDSGNLTTTKTVTVTVIKDENPVIKATNKTININSTFNPLSGVEATDKEDGNLTNKIQVVKNTVNTKTAGTYEVIYQVTDSFSHKVQTKINVVVVNNTKQPEEQQTTTKEKEGLYYFNYLKVVNNKLQIKGYHAIKGVNHTKNTNITYKLLFVNINTNKEYTISAERIMNENEFERPVYSTDNYDYTYSWFKANIDIDILEDGDYKAYIVTESNGYIAKTIISNKVLKEQVATYKSKKTLTTRNNYRDSKIPLEFVIRSTPIGEKTANSTYNEYNQYRTLEFVNNKLKLFGTSYSMGMNLSKNTKVERKIVFENIKTFKKYTYDASSTTEGLYQVGTTLGDNLDKSRAWFSTEMDLSQIEKGEYAIYISTKSNISDYGELNELLFRSLDDVVLKKDNKTYSFRINKDLRYRIELIVK